MNPTTSANDRAHDLAHDLAESAATEWSGLVNAAVLGTDRKPVPIPRPGWESLGRGSDGVDPAVELLDRVASVVTARRAGIQPAPAPAPMPAAPVDDRPICSRGAARALAEMLDGRHDQLLPEWFVLCRAGGYQPPAHLVPTLLLRGRRNPAFDLAARALIGPRAEWLAEAMPELRIRSHPKAPAVGVDPFLPPRPPSDSAAVVAAIVQTFVDRSASWAAAAQLRLAVTAIDPAWLAALILELDRAPFHSVTERSRVDLLGLAQLRSRMIAELAPPETAKRVGLWDG